MEGFVKSLIPGKFYGFILDPLTTKEYFFHKQDFSGHWDDLQDDFEKKFEIRVSFDIDLTNPKGPRAANVKRLVWPNEG